MTGGLWVTSDCVCFFVCVWEGRGFGGRKKAGGDWAKNFKLFMVHGGCSGTDNRILEFFWFTFCPFLIFFCLDYQMIFIWQKKRSFSEVTKLCKRYYICWDGLWNYFFCRKPRCLLFWRILNRLFYLLYN